MLNFKSNRGASAIEYALIAGLISAGGVTLAYANTGSGVQTTMCRAADYITGGDGTKCGSSTPTPPADPPPPPPDPYTICAAEGLSYNPNIPGADSDGCTTYAQRCNAVPGYTYTDLGNGNGSCGPAAPPYNPADHQGRDQPTNDAFNNLSPSDQTFFQGEYDMDVAAGLHPKWYLNPNGSFGGVSS